MIESVAPTPDSHPWVTNGVSMKQTAPFQPPPPGSCLGPDSTSGKGHQMVTPGSGPLPQAI